MVFKLTFKKITMKEHSYNWLLYKKSRIKESTFFRYNYIIEKYINPKFGNYKLSTFQDYDFNNFTNNLSIKLSEKTTKDIILVLKSILRYGEQKYNYNFKLDLISIPKQFQKELKILDTNEKNTLENLCLEKGSFRDIGIIICLNTGIRIGEICALTWENIDLNQNIIIVKKTMQRIYKSKGNTFVSINSPKTFSSNRIIPISDKLHSILNNIYEENHFKSNDFFLTGHSKKFVEPRNYQYYFEKRLKECNLQNYKFHILRHTFATDCISIGMDVKSLSEILGHSSVSITLNKYVHSSVMLKKKYLEKL